jgi:hypothetical protein
MNNERLKALLDAMVRLCELWNSMPPAQSSHAVYRQIEFVKRAIREELKK